MNCKKTFWGYKHNWSRWEVIDEGNILSGNNRIGKYLVQGRTCKDCNFKELKSKKLRTI